MQLLRDNQDTLLTILEVLLCDPLYSWTITSKQQDILTIRKWLTKLTQVGALVMLRNSKELSLLYGTKHSLNGPFNSRGYTGRT